MAGLVRGLMSGSDGHRFNKCGFERVIRVAHWSGSDKYFVELKGRHWHRKEVHDYLLRASDPATGSGVGAADSPATEGHTVAMSGVFRARLRRSRHWTREVLDEVLAWRLRRDRIKESSTASAPVPEETHV